MSAQAQKQTSDEERRDMVQKWKASGLTQAEFCRQENIREWSLSFWKRKEAERQALLDVGATTTKTARPLGKPPKRGKGASKYWENAIKEQTASGLSRREFCRRHGLSLRCFNRWFAKLARESRQIPTAAAVENPFVAMQLANPSTEFRSLEHIEIHLPGGSMLSVTEQTPLQLLAKLLHALEATC